MDSGASDNYFPATFTGENHRCPTISHAVGTANGNIMRSVATDRFTMPGIPRTGRECKKFHEVELPLVSVGKLCVNGMKVSFDDKGVEVKNKSNGTIVTTGRRDPVRNLYMLPIPSSVQHKPQGVGLNLIEPVQATKNELCAANAYEIRAVPALISYLHGCAGYIPKATWIAGIDKGFYATWPGLTSARVQKYLRKSEITTLGHQKLVRKNI